MSRSLVEKYESMLSQDPKSTVFVELARAYIERGDNELAVTVCSKGCEFHPGSIVGRVLWGKALINLGKAADAMGQFDKAIAIDKDNPHAYNLISELLLRKQMFRSALPILRKAAALQPNDGRISQWVEQTRAALAGGPAPVLYDSTAVVTPDMPETTDATQQVSPELVAAARAALPAQPKITAGSIPSIAPAGSAPAPAKPVPTIAPLNMGALMPASAPPVESSPGSEFDLGLDEDQATRVGQMPAQLLAMREAKLAELAAAIAKPDPVYAAPSLSDDAEKTQAGMPAITSDVFSQFFPSSSAPPAGEATVVMQALDKSGETTGPGISQESLGPPVPTQEIPAVRLGGRQPITAELPMIGASLDAPGETQTLGDDSRAMTGEMPRQGSQPEAPDPLGMSGPSDVVRGLTTTFEALSGAPAAGQVPMPDEPAKAPPMLAPTPEAPAARGGGLLDEVDSAQSMIPTGELQVDSEGNIAGFGPMKGGAAARSVPEPTPSNPGGGGLLGDLPDLEPEASGEVSSPFKSSPSGFSENGAAFSTQATEAIAREYERELRQKLEVSSQKKTFLQKHGLKLGLGIGALVIVVGLIASYAYTNRKNAGESLQSALLKGSAAVTADTKEQYENSLTLNKRALSMDSSNRDALGAIALANAVLFAEHGKDPKRRDAAVEAVNRDGVREAHPEIAVVVDFLTADTTSMTNARQALLTAAGAEDAKSLSLGEAGKLMLADKKYEEAFTLLQKAVEANPKNVRALVALGEYYLHFEDPENAVTVLSGAAQTLSRYHPQRVLLLTDARLTLGREAKEALGEIEAIKGNATVPPDLMTQYTMLLGQAQAAGGKAEEAIKTLTEGLAAHPDQALGFNMALGQAYRSAGQMGPAQKAYEEAIKLAPKSEEAKEALGRVLLARSREKELLEKLKPEADARRIALVRGIAYLRMNDAKRARAELTKTQVKGKYPQEAVVYMALADAAEEKGDKVVTVLEDMAGKAKRNKAVVQVALAQIYMQRGALDKARPILEEAAKDPQDYEGNTLLGQLLLSAGVNAETAMEPLIRAVERNGSHSPARHLLTQAYVAQGKLSEAQKQIDAWLLDNPASEVAWLDSAMVSLHSGKAKDAAAAIAKGLRSDSTDLNALRLAAQVNFASGNPKGGFQALERANKLNSKDAETFCEIGHAFVRGGTPETAVQAYGAAKDNDPKSFCGALGPHFAMRSAKGSGKVSPREELSALISRAETAWEKANAQGTLALVLIDDKKLTDAASAADEAVATDPYSAIGWFAVSQVAKRQKNAAHALEALQKAAEYDASWLPVRMAYADELLNSRGKESAEKALVEYSAVAAMAGDFLNPNEGDVARARKQVIALKKVVK